MGANLTTREALQMLFKPITAPVKSVIDDLNSVPEIASKLVQEEGSQKPKPEEPDPDEGRIMIADGSVEDVAAQVLNHGLDRAYQSGLVKYALGGVATVGFLYGAKDRRSFLKRSVAAGFTWLGLDAFMPDYLVAGDKQHTDTKKIEIKRDSGTLPEPCYSMNEKAVTLAVDGHYSEAISLYKNALEICPHSAILRNGLGFAYKQNSMFSEAISELLIAKDLDPNNSSIFLNLGSSYKKLGIQEGDSSKYHDEMRRYLTRFLELDPNSRFRSAIERDIGPVR